MEDELYHYGVKGMKWGVRKKFRASEAQRKRQHKESMKNIRDSYDGRIKQQKALTKATKGSNPTVHKLSKETTDYLKSEKKHNLAAERDRYKYHYSKKGDRDRDAFATNVANLEKTKAAKKAYKKDPSDSNRKTYEQALYDGMAYMSSPAYKKLMADTYAAALVGGPLAAAGYQYVVSQLPK